jgi:hypothetical protein
MGSATAKSPRFTVELRCVAGFFARLLLHVFVTTFPKVGPTVPRRTDASGSALDQAASIQDDAGQ